jgi:hypothetical protein
VTTVRRTLDPETGEIVVVTEEERALAEDPCSEEAPAWQREMMPKIRAALDSEPGWSMARPLNTEASSRCCLK